MANEIYLKHGITVVFGSEGGDDVAWTTEGVTNGSGRQSAQHDFGVDTAARPDELQIRFFTQCQATTPVIGNTIDVYAKTSDHATLHLDNDEGTGDIALSSSDKLKNLHYVGSAIVDEVVADIEFVLSTRFITSHRYIHFVFENNSGASITSDVAETKLEMTPIYYQGQ
jgi:hypothetical protein